MSEEGERRKVRKSESPKVSRKSIVESPKSEEGDNSVFDIPHSEMNNKSEIEHPKRQSPLELLKKTNDSEKSEINMEVHHHPEVEKKGFKEYILEGLMIFLAVTMGFFAESLREHISETNMANDQAHNFYEELKSDSAAVTLAVKNWDRKNQALFYMKKYFAADSSLTNCSKTFSINFYYAFRVNSPSKFEPKTVILEQLKNSGSLRYFKSKELQQLTGELSVAIANVRQRNEVDNYYFENYINQFVINYNDPLWYDQINPHDEQVFAALINYEKSNLIVPFHFNNPGGFKRNESLNMIGGFQLIMKSTRFLQYNKYQVLNHTLLEELRKEYDIK